MNYWTPSLRFSGETVFILGGGPSLADVSLRQLPAERVIAINNAGELLPEATVLFWRDARWFAANTRLVETWRGLVVSPRPRVEKLLNGRAILLERRADFPAPGSGVVRWGPSSGHVACALAIAMGACRVVLLGFDCRPVAGRTHWHSHYREDRAAVLYPHFARGWTGWRDGAERLGVEIVNATPGSAIGEFPIAPLKSEIRQAA